MALFFLHLSYRLWPTKTEPEGMKLGIWLRSSPFLEFGPVRHCLCVAGFAGFFCEAGSDRP